jgi:fucose permease
MTSVVGGAIGPLAMGWVGDHFSISTALAVPFATFVIVLAFSVFSLARSQRASLDS